MPRDHRSGHSSAASASRQRESRSLALTVAHPAADPAADPCERLGAAHDPRSLTARRVDVACTKCLGPISLGLGHRLRQQVAADSARTVRHGHGGQAAAVSGWTCCMRHASARAAARPRRGVAALRKRLAGKRYATGALTPGREERGSPPVADCGGALCGRAHGPSGGARAGWVVVRPPEQRAAHQLHFPLVQAARALQHLGDLGPRLLCALELGGCASLQPPVTTLARNYHRVWFPREMPAVPTRQAILLG